LLLSRETSSVYSANCDMSTKESIFVGTDENTVAFYGVMKYA